MKYTVELSMDEIDNIILKDLRERYVEQRTLWHHEPDAKKLAKAFLKVIEYYSVPSEYREWLETVKDL